MCLLIVDFTIIISHSQPQHHIIASLRQTRLAQSGWTTMSKWSTWSMQFTTRLLARRSWRREKLILSGLARARTTQSCCRARCKTKVRVLNLGTGVRWLSVILDLFIFRPLFCFLRWPDGAIRQVEWSLYPSAIHRRWGKSILLHNVCFKVAKLESVLIIPLPYLYTRSNHMVCA